MEVLKKIKNRLIVSCQALPDEPLHGSCIMAKMALAAKQGGASGIRANTVEDIHAIKLEIDLPIIGIIKQHYPDNNVFITPSLKEVGELYKEGVDIIALDATRQARPNGMNFETFLADIKEKYPDQLFMADISTIEEGIIAEKSNVDVIATTLVGHTPYSKGCDSLNVVKDLVNYVSIPVIAEGNFDTPMKVEKALELGAHAVVVGTAITRPQDITKKFKQAELNFNNELAEEKEAEK